MKMLVNIDDVQTVKLTPGVEERVLLRPELTDSGDLTVKHHTLTEGEIAFIEEGVEYQHYIISGCALMRGHLLHENNRGPT